MNEVVARNNAQITAFSWQRQYEGQDSNAWHLEVLLLHMVLRSFGNAIQDWEQSVTEHDETEKQLEEWLK